MPPPKGGWRATAATRDDVSAGDVVMGSGDGTPRSSRHGSDMDIESRGGSRSLTTGRGNALMGVHAFGMGAAGAATCHGGRWQGEFRYTK